MQPYFVPYIGYFQLISAVDLFMVYDNIKYTKKGWINRNRMLQNGKGVIISIPLKRDSDYVNVCQRELASDFNPERLLNRIKGAYQHAPYFAGTYPLIEQIVRYEDTNLFRFLQNAIVTTCNHLSIKTNIAITSDIDIDHDLTGQDKVLALCSAVGANDYVNAIGGENLYSKDKFRNNGIELKFLHSKPFEYSQFGSTFIPWLSIIDVMMFNSLDRIETCVSSNFELI